LTTHTECERESDWETQADALLNVEPTATALAMRRRAYDDAVARALLDESDDERAERIELVEAAQALVMQAFLAHQKSAQEPDDSSSDAQEDEYATFVHSS
jgi:hypothetical protein